MIWLLLCFVALLAYANGSNDNSKGVATLVGYGAATPRKALLYATLATAIGGGLSFWFSGGLLKSFSTGLFAKGTTLDMAFFASVLIGAFGWVIFATLTGLPVSTTHAITGALIGAGLMAKAQILWAFLGKGFVRPLVLSPIVSLAAVYLLAWPVVWIVKRISTRQKIEVENVIAISAQVPGGSAQVIEYESTQRLVTTSPAANALHWLSGGFISFARGWNDTPKIAALALVALPNRSSIGFVIVTIAMAAGGLISGTKVLQTLARKLTPLPLPESLTASLTTATLVCLASWNGLPVSTTHVSTGAIIGAGLKNDPGSVKWKKVTEIVLSWVITLPAAGLLAAGARLILR
ncbi:MAG TPA: inorganic phosphate transporter [Humisphaera sp.]|jgi:PiT family inorganic phosphate transporter|nr:inorganic phosphate transporter [Humisphaera sp.]